MAKTDKKEAAPSKQEVVAAQTGGSVAPSFMKKFAGQGGENIQSKDLMIPRVVLLQATSPQVTQDGEKVGDFYHLVAEESLGAELKFVPILYTKQLILWNPRENGGGILARAAYNAQTKDFDAWNPSNEKFEVKIKNVKKPVVWETKNSVKESGLLNWGTFNPEDPKSQPAATEIHSFLCIATDHEDLGPFILAFQRSAVKPARKLLSRLALKPDLPFFGQKFILSSVDEKNKDGDGFKNYTFTGDGLVEDEAQFLRYASIYDRLKTQSFDIKDVEGMQGDIPVGDEEGSTAGKVSEKF